MHTIIKNSQYSPDVKTIFDHLTALVPGATATYGTLGALIGRDVRPQSRDYSILASAIKRAERAKVRVVNISGIGYKRLTSEEVATIDLERGQKAVKRCTRRADHRLDCAEDSELSSQAKTKKYTAKAGYSIIEHVSKGQPVIEHVVSQQLLPDIRSLLEALK